MPFDLKTWLSCVAEGGLTAGVRTNLSLLTEDWTTGAQSLLVGESVNFSASSIVNFAFIAGDFCILLKKSS